MGGCFHALHRIARAAGSGLFALSVLFAAFSTAEAQIIETAAGTSSIAGRPARSISVRPWGLAMAPDGAVYVADRDHSQVLRFDPVAQTFSVVAGTTVPGIGGDGGPAISAQLSLPTAVAIDAVGNLLIADSDRVRRVDAVSGIISTVAGGGESISSGILAREARLQAAESVTVGPDGSIYIAERDGARIRRVDPNSGLIFTIAGTGQWGYTGDYLAAVNAQLAGPTDVALDALGNIYIADQFNHAVRIIDAATGIIQTYAGVGDPSTEVIDGGPARFTRLSSPTTLRFDLQGNLLITEAGTGRIRKVDAVTTIVSTIAGGGSEFEGVPALSGRIDMPQGLALAANGDLYVSSQSRSLIQRISGDTGLLEVVAGNSWPHFSGDGGPAIAAQMWPTMTVVNANSDLFLLDNSRIRRVDATTGVISTYAGNGEPGVVGDGGPAIGAFLFYPTVLAADAAGNLFVSDQSNHRIRKINAATGIISHYAGTGFGSSGDGGPAVNAQMRQIRDMATDAAGNLFVIEDGGARIRKINAATGIITSIAGNGNTSGSWGDGQLATNVSLYPLDAIALDRQSNIFIVQRNRIRRISAASGIITTVAGTGLNQEYGDGGPALSAGIVVSDLKVDIAGNIFITSIYTQRVRRIDAVTKMITTVSGTAFVQGFSGDGGPATAALLDWPRDLTLNSVGDLYITERYRVRRVAGIGSTTPPGDTTPPTITSGVSGPLGNNGWYRNNVTVTWTVADPESAIQSAPGCTTTIITTDTAGLTLTCTATSAGGTSSKSVTIKRDATVPQVVFGTPSPAANAAGWNNTDVTIAATISDAFSGVVGTTQRTIVAGQQGANVQYGVSVSDLAGNGAVVYVPQTFNIDKTPPTVTVTTPGNGATYAIGSTVPAAYSCGDTLSGIATCTGMVPVGSPIDTATNGNKIFNMSVTDRAGNMTVSTVSYNVDTFASPAYCSSRGNSSTYEFIKAVQVGSSVNNSSSNGGYADFSLNPIPVLRGANSLVVTPGFGGGGYTENWRVWIDFNRDGVFATDELLFSGTASIPLQGTLNVPATALSGMTRMRVSMSFGAPASPCGTFSFGEVEDYRVSIP